MVILKQWIKLIWLVITNWEQYRYWRSVQKGEKTIDYTRGTGYYITLGIIGYDPIGEKEEYKMESGRTGIYELIDYESHLDPHDMVKESFWHFIGYKEEKPVKECSFPEFMEIYT